MKLGNGRVPRADLGCTWNQGRPFWDLGKQSLGKPSPKCRCFLCAVPGSTVAELCPGRGLWCRNPSQAGCRRGDGAGPGQCSHCPTAMGSI